MSRKSQYLESLKPSQERALSLSLGSACDSNLRFEMGWLDRVIKKSEKQDPYSPTAATGRTAARVAQYVGGKIAGNTAPGLIYRGAKALHKRFFKRNPKGEFTASQGSRKQRHLMLMSQQPAKMGVMDSLLKLTGGRHEDEHGRSLTGGYRVRDTPENRAITEKHGAENIGGIGERSRAAPERSLVQHLTGGTRLHKIARARAMRQYQRDQAGKFASHGEVTMGLLNWMRGVKDENEEIEQHDPMTGKLIGKKRRGDIRDEQHRSHVKYHKKEEGSKHIRTFRVGQTIHSHFTHEPTGTNYTLITHPQHLGGFRDWTEWKKGHSKFNESKHKPVKFSCDVAMGVGDVVKALKDHYFRSSGNRFRSDEGDPPIGERNRIAVKDVIAHHKAKEAEHEAKRKTYDVKSPLPGTRGYAKRHKAERDRHAAVRTHYEALQRSGKTHVSQRQYERDKAGRFA